MMDKRRSLFPVVSTSRLYWRTLLANPSSYAFAQEIEVSVCGQYIILEVVGTSKSQQ